MASPEMVLLTGEGQEADRSHDEPDGGAGLGARRRAAGQRLSLATREVPKRIEAPAGEQGPASGREAGLEEGAALEGLLGRGQ